MPELLSGNDKTSWRAYTKTDVKENQVHFQDLHSISDLTHDMSAVNSDSTV